MHECNSSVSCKHTNVEYCEHCGKVYCVTCGMEWEAKCTFYHYQSYTPYGVDPYGVNPYWPTTDTPWCGSASTFDSINVTETG